MRYVRVLNCYRYEKVILLYVSGFKKISIYDLALKKMNEQLNVYEIDKLKFVIESLI